MADEQTPEDLERKEKERRGYLEPEY